MQNTVQNRRPVGISNSLYISHESTEYTEIVTRTS